MRKAEDVVEVRRRYLRPLFEKWRNEGRTFVFLARKLSTTRQILNDWKQGRRGISEDNLRSLCIEVGIARDLLGTRPYAFRELPPRRKQSA